jgi:hypothetical protein
MGEKSHYHERIHRATQQLAQLQAKELLVSQRRAAQAKKQAKRDELRRKAQVAEIVFQIGAEALPDVELAALLAKHMAGRCDVEKRVH